MITAKIIDIKHFAIHDGRGIRTTVFFKGCPLNCIWCHNPEAISMSKELAFYEHKCVGCGECAKLCACHRIENGKHTFERQNCIHCNQCTEVCPAEALKIYGAEYTVSAIVDTVLKDVQFYNASGGGVTLSGGEPLLQIDFVEELSKKLCDLGISVNVDTCGMVNQSAFERIIPYTDTFLYDVKAISPELHKKCTGRDNGVILSNLDFLCDSRCKINIRYPFIKGINDGELDSIGQYLKGKKAIEKVTVLRYHDFARSKYLAIGRADTMPLQKTTYEDVRNAVDVLEQKYGLHAVCGNDD